MLHKNIPSNSLPVLLQEPLPERLFIPSDEAAAFLNLPEKEVRDFGRAGVLQEFWDGPIVLYKTDHINALAEKLGSRVEPVEEKPKDHTGTINLVIWAACGLVTFAGIFARRIYLLETAVPALAFIGFITFGIVLYKGYKEKERLRQKAATERETEQILSQVERFERLHERK